MALECKANVGTGDDVKFENGRSDTTVVQEIIINGEVDSNGLVFSVCNKHFKA